MAPAVTVAELMETSGVQFGTSGARGMVVHMTDAVCYTYTAGFLQYLENKGEMTPTDRRVALAGDYRSSTGRIMTAVAQAIVDRGYQVVHCGHIPSPAVALYGMQQRIPAIMVTGSHIPDDRNGIKFNTATGEVLKEDEAGMRAQVVELPAIFTEENMLRNPASLPPVDDGARNSYLQRWLDAFPLDFLAGRSLLLYQHSAVGRDLLHEILLALGAEVTSLGRSEQFIPVDTEAIREQDVHLADLWATSYAFDAIISTDGDSDRPLIADEHGKWLRGDVIGILCAEYLGADIVVTPVSCNSAVEKCGFFHQVRRTRIGSPYVIAAMQQAVADGGQRVVGYEANGGFLTASPMHINGRELPPLPTRDPLIVALALLGLAAREQSSISHLIARLPKRVTASGRISHLPTHVSAQQIAALIKDGPPAMVALFPWNSVVIAYDTTDGLRITFANEDIIHLRPSGNAPELRCYTESNSERAAKTLLHQALERLHAWTE